MILIFVLPRLCGCVGWRAEKQGKMSGMSHHLYNADNPPLILKLSSRSFGLSSFRRIVEKDSIFVVIHNSDSALCSSKRRRTGECIGFEQTELLGREESTEGLSDSSISARATMLTLANDIVTFKSYHSVKIKDLDFLRSEIV